MCPWRHLPPLVLGLCLLAPGCTGKLQGNCSTCNADVLDDLGSGDVSITPSDLPTADSGDAPTLNPLKSVAYWAYQIQGLTQSGAVDRLVASRYDLLVLEPTRTDKQTSSFDSKGMVQQLHATTGKSGNTRLVLAYVDIGEAESWRYYWDSSWTPRAARTSLV